MRAILSLVVLAASFVVAKPANDWNKPCFHGECAYDLTENNGGSGAVKIYGEPKSITDITPSAGWVILNCDPNAMAQDIRLVCMSEDAKSAGCAHMFDHGGPLNKVVRLPESCGPGPFARIASVRVANDQSIPAHVEGKISARDGAAPTVHIVSIDDNFAAVDPAQTGPVHFIVFATSVPGVEVDLPFRPTVQARSTEWFWDWLVGAITGGIKKLVGAIKDATKLKTETKTDIPVSKSGSTTLFDQTAPCGSITGHLKATVEGSVDMKITLGIGVDGSVIPPQLNKFGAYAAINGDIDAHMQIDASVIGTVEAPPAQLFEIGLTPIQVPAIFSLGPKLTVSVYGRADLDLNVIIDARIGYHIENLEFWYPPSMGKGSPKIESKDKPLSLSVATGNVRAEVTGHIVPALKLGFSAIGGRVALNAFVEADGYAKLRLGAGTRKRRTIDASPAVPQVADRAYIPPYGYAARTLATRAASANFDGCFDIDLGIVISGGGEGKLFGIGSEKKWEIFRKELNIFHKCWGKAKRAISMSETTLVRRAQGLSCKGGNPVSLGGMSSSRKSLT